MYRILKGLVRIKVADEYSVCVMMCIHIYICVNMCMCVCVNGYVLGVFPCENLNCKAGYQLALHYTARPPLPADTENI